MAVHILPDLPERWKPIKNWPCYEVSTYGQVRSYKGRGRSALYPKAEPSLMVFEKHRQGYLRVKLSNRKMHRKFLVHRLVAEAFLPNPENKPEVNHKDGNKADNRFFNLEWATPKENQAHAVSYGLAVDVRKLSRKLSDGQVIQARFLHQQGTDIPCLSSQFNLSVSAMAAIVARRSYVDVA
jgi:hypothetical protein